MPYFTFSQNNSGGSFVLNDAVSEWVIIWGRDYRDANRRAEDIGIYFDGVDRGMDCDCCGDRWSAQSSYDKGDDEPSIYGESVEKFFAENDSFRSRRKVIVYDEEGNKKVHEKEENS